VTEEDARAWIGSTFDVSRETFARLETYCRMLLAEGERQNLIAASTRQEVWARHIADSAQLLLHAPAPQGLWLDLGSGAGLPGIVVAMLSGWNVHLVESRAKRICFLNKVVTALGLNAVVHGGRAEMLALPPASARVISARAFAPLPKLLESASRFATRKTLWLLPKGKNAQIELASVAPAWQKLFHVEQSVTDTESRILVGTGVAQTPKQGKRI
jgi:16S rRNA (guanine527-N7)-methyltransferase